MLPEINLELEWRGKRYADVERGLRVVALDVDKDFNAIMPIVRKEIRQYMEAVVTSVQRRTEGAYPGGTSAAGVFPGTLSRRSGKLSQSLSKDKIVVGDGTAETSVAFTISGIASVHETGAVIRPKRSQYLTIPLPAALNGQGIPLKASARDWQNTFVARSKAGNLLIFRKDGTKITPIYVLKKSVTIPKRLAFREAFEAGKNFLADRIAQQVLKEFQS